MELSQNISDETQRHSAPSAPAPAPARQEFLFVDAAKAKSSRQGRRNARSFVMQKARKERPWSTSKRTARQKTASGDTSPGTSGIPTPDLTHTSTTPTPSPPFVHSENGYFSSANWHRSLVVKQEMCSDHQFVQYQHGQYVCPKCLFVQSQAPPEDLENSFFDPFGTMAVKTDAQVSILLEHFFTNMAPVAIALDIQKRSDLMRLDWWETAKSSTAFMHSLLCTAALHQLYCGRETLGDVVYHRGEAVTAINSALSKLNSSAGLSDANIGAVFNLMTIEESLVHIQNGCEDEQTDQRKVHYEGLRRMIQMRGGLLALGSNRMLQAFILWHSTAHAIATFDLPYLSTDDLVSVASNPRHPTGYRPKISQHLLDCCRVARVRESLTTIVQSVLILIADLNALFDDAHSQLDPVDIQNYACVLECMLLQWLRENENVVSPLEDALCVALLIFTVRTTEAFRYQPDTHPFHLAAILKLKKALSATSRHEWQSCPDLLLYILAIGAVSADGSAEGPWFVSQTSLACSEYGILDVDALLEHLHVCGWVGFKLGGAVRHLWGKITRLRLEPLLDETTSSAGPLQTHVASPDFTDWQNIDWSTLAEVDGEAFGRFTASPVFGGEETLYDFGDGHTFHHNGSLYM